MLGIPIENHDRSVLETKKRLCNEYEYMRQKARQLRSHRIAQLKLLARSFASRVNELLATPSNFVSLEEETIRSELELTDGKIIGGLERLSGLVQRKLRLAGEKSGCIEDDHQTLKDAAGLVREVMTFAAYLAFETHGKISVKQISRSPSQFSRCKKAVLTNTKQSVFAGSAYTGVEVVEAFKLENAFLLKRFEKRHKAMRGHAILKGLFSVVDQSQIYTLILSGLAKPFGLAEVSQIPQTLRKKAYGDPGKKLADILRDHNAGFSCPMYMSNYSAGEELRPFLTGKESAQRIFLIALCRVIVPQDHAGSGRAGPENEVFYSKLKDSYEIHNLNLIYPEYILACRLQRAGTDQPKEQDAMTRSFAKSRPSAQEKQRCFETVRDSLSTNPVQAEIAKIEDEEATIYQNIKTLHVQFWGQINTRVQKEVHPRLIEEREFVRTELKAQIEEGKKTLKMLAGSSAELGLILGE